jgi:hypothetical protein
MCAQQHNIFFAKRGQIAEVPAANGAETGNQKFHASSL